jgi:hypothetical protein
VLEEGRDAGEAEGLAGVEGGGGEEEGEEVGEEGQVQAGCGEGYGWW